MGGGGGLFKLGGGWGGGGEGRVMIKLSVVESHKTKSGASQAAEQCGFHVRVVFVMYPLFSFLLVVIVVDDTVLLCLVVVHQFLCNFWKSSIDVFGLSVYFKP